MQLRRAFSSTPTSPLNLSQYTRPTLSPPPPFYAARAKAHDGSTALTLTFTPNEEAAKCGLTACSVPASLKKDKVSLQVIGDSSGAAPWRTLRESMNAAKLEPVPVLSPTIFFTRAANGTVSVDADGIPLLSEPRENITKYLDVKVALRGAPAQQEVRPAAVRSGHVL